MALNLQQGYNDHGQLRGAINMKIKKLIIISLYSRRIDQNILKVITPQSNGALQRGVTVRIRRSASAHLMQLV